jgi:hypothetical protein
MKHAVPPSLAAQIVSHRNYLEDVDVRDREILRTTTFSFTTGGKLMREMSRAESLVKDSNIENFSDTAQASLLTASASPLSATQLLSLLSFPCQVIIISLASLFFSSPPRSAAGFRPTFGFAA